MGILLLHNQLLYVILYILKNAMNNDSSSRIVDKLSAFTGFAIRNRNKVRIYLLKVVNDIEKENISRKDRYTYINNIERTNKLMKGYISTIERMKLLYYGYTQYDINIQDISIYMDTLNTILNDLYMYRNLCSNFESLMPNNNTK